LLQQFVANPEVSLHVLVKFQSPELLSSLGYGGISAAWVPMPEAAVNKDADPVAGQHQIGLSRKTFLVQAIPEAMPMQ